MQSLLEENSIIRFLFVFLLGIILIRIWRTIACKTGLVDKPDARKLHAGVIPLVGGLAVYSSIVIVAVILGRNNTEFLCYLALSGILVVTGTLDDKFTISAKFRLFIEFVAACVMIFGAGVYVKSLGNLFGLGDIALPLVVALPFTLLLVAGYINAMNMSDGIDGMAASLSVMTIITLLILMHGRDNLFILPIVTLAAALMAFLVYNLQLIKGIRKVFLGDAGSMLLGFTFVWLVIRLSEGDRFIQAQFSPVTALYVLGLPLVDMVSTIIRRMKKGQNPLKPDRTHVHHILLRAGFTLRQTLLITIVLGAIFHGIGISLHYASAPDWAQFAVFLGICGIYYRAVAKAFRLSQILRLLRKTRHPVRLVKALVIYRRQRKHRLAEQRLNRNLTHQINH
ncbi:Undecaprenyl-phosphate alpha-N-acetylglucosaminyl 1-phosphate transferase [invertebrate metagenome]|uniref:Undecaprenyl-phosphate alpha-N-acetylglucosaminyl 1-phosphate transferase n=1 Tax=invertebrate metagenome TaxID=1711999 RepID=A0A2H9T6D0_9ZZZZ